MAEDLLGREGQQKVAKWRCMRSMIENEPAVGFIAPMYCTPSIAFIVSFLRS